MTSNSAEILSLAMQLPLSERAKVAHELLLSLEGEPFDDDWGEAWAAELEKRSQEMEAGTVDTMSAQEVIDELRASLRKKES